MDIPDNQRIFPEPIEIGQSFRNPLYSLFSFKWWIVRFAIFMKNWLKNENPHHSTMPNHCFQALESVSLIKNGKLFQEVHFLSSWTKVYIAVQTFAAPVKSFLSIKDPPRLIPFTSLRWHTNVRSTLCQPKACDAFFIHQNLLCNQTLLITTHGIQRDPPKDAPVNHWSSYLFIPTCLPVCMIQACFLPHKRPKIYQCQFLSITQQ